MFYMTGWVPDPERDFGARLALVRQHRAWNIRRAAEACGIDPASWHGWETKARMPRDYQAVCEKIADGSGCELVWLTMGSLTHRYGSAWALAA